MSSVAMLRWMTGAVAFWFTVLGMMCVPEMLAERRYRLQQEARRAALRRHNASRHQHRRPIACRETEGTPG